MAKKIANKQFMERKEYIEYLSNQSNEISMPNKNSKTGMACLNLGMPTCVCRSDAPCYEKCYARKGTQQIAVVQAAYYRNLRLYNDDPDEFFEQVYYKIKFSGLPLVRWFDSGDLPSYDFLERVVELCKRTPTAKHMMFTKKYDLVNQYLDVYKTLPDNLNIMFSAWDKLWDVPNPYGLGVAYVDFDDKRMNPDFPKNTFVCPGKESTCSMCRACWNKKLKAVLFKQH